MKMFLDFLLKKEEEKRDVFGLFLGDENAWKELL